MLHENEGEWLKQERKCEYKISTLHVLINETFSFRSLIKVNNKETKSRDVGCFLMLTNSQGCLTALMENLKNVINTSLDIGYTKFNFTDLFLTRVNIDPSLLTIDRTLYSNLSCKNSKIEINRFNFIITLPQPTVTEHKWCNDSLKKHSRIIDSSREPYKNLKNKNKNFRDNLFFIHLRFSQGYKRFTVNNNFAHEHILIYADNTTASESYYISGKDYRSHCRSTTYSDDTLTSQTPEYAKNNLKTSRIQSMQRYTLMIDYSNKITTTKVVKSRFVYWSSSGNGNMSTIFSHSNWVLARYYFYISSSIKNEMTNDLVDLIESNTSDIKTKTQMIYKTCNIQRPRTKYVDKDMFVNIFGSEAEKQVDKNYTSVFSPSKNTNVVLLSSHFHALLARGCRKVRPQEHLEVGVKVRWQLHPLDSVEERNQIEERCTWSFASPYTTVVDNSDAIVTVLTRLSVVVVSRCTEVTIKDSLTVTAVVVVVGVGTRITRTGTGTAGRRTTNGSLIDANKMWLNAVSWDERNVRDHTMMPEHQLARTTACLEKRRKFNKDESYRAYHVCYAIYYHKVMIYHQIWQGSNKILHTVKTITIDGCKSHNVVVMRQRSAYLFTFFFDFSIDLIFTIFHLTGTLGYQLDINVTDKGYLQNAMPDKTTIECFLSILSIFIEGSLRTRKVTKLHLIEQTTRNNNQKNFYVLSQIFLIVLSNFNCHSTYFVNKLIHDIEPNPGPISDASTKVTLTIVTLNCRGLGSTDKFRLILNKAHELMTKGETIIMLQETMVANDNYLKLAWRGNSVFTPGTGNSLGCITLTNATSNISLINQIGNRGHYFTYSSPLITTAIIMNLYAPQGFDEAKTDFFIDNFNIISNYDCDIIVGGDMNVTLRPNDRHCRGVTNAELTLAEEILGYQQALGLEDTWQGKSGYTWQKGQKMSKLDRIFYRITNFKLKTNRVDWTLAKTDHAAVIAKFEHTQNVIHKSTHVKLDNDILKDNVKLNELKEYVVNQLNDPQVATFNPHVKLEFAKMSIRTKALDIMARCRKQKNELLNEINREIITNTRLLGTENDARLKNMLIRELETLKVQKDAILNEQGEKLANLARTKWYNEGEKSNKYFLNMLKRQQSRSDMNCLIINGVECTNSDIIKEHVKDFYRHLYNHGRNTQIAPTFLDNMFTVDADLNNSIIADITLNELWQTLKSLRATTPGPDGISNTYLKKLFDIMGPLIIEAWRYSLQKNELMWSHKNSFLRLIPKPGKDPKELKNWRPITLSNCDHKLITKTYNSRLLNIIKDYITPTQTAYIKGRNIADNLRLLNALTKNGALNQDVNVSAVALDAQKAFDSVNHAYLCEILKRIGLTNFVPIFQLLYKDLANDIIINGKAEVNFKICNGVKQGDALSCSLFILAIEPVIRNIQANDEIIPVTCNRLNYTWPKVLAYADDITVLTKNSHRSVQAIFTEYEKLSQASGLFLNADKTELFNITSPHNFAMQQHHVRYANNTYTIINSMSVKINDSDSLNTYTR